MNDSVRPAELAEKAARLRELHIGPGMLVLPSAWDAASAKVFEAAGFAAIATTSGGVAGAPVFGITNWHPSTRWLRQRGGSPVR